MADRRRVPVLGHLQLLIPLALVFPLLGLELTAVDTTVSRWFLGSPTALWPWRNHWLTERVLHRGGRDLVVFIGLGVLVALIASLWVSPLKPERRRLTYLFLAMALSIGLVGLWRAHSAVHCPWDVEGFGGAFPRIRPFAPVSSLPAGVPAGHCFPGAHAASGFSLVAFYFAFRNRSRLLAWGGLALGLSLGNIYGLSQVARGAHFLSHHLWSGLLVWEVCAGLYWLGTGFGLRAPSALVSNRKEDGHGP